MQLIPANDRSPLAAMAAQVRREHETREAAAKRETARGRGVAWGGLTAAVYEFPSDAKIEAEAEARLTVRERFAASSRGRFLAALNKIRDAGVYAYEAEVARKAYDRGFADENAPISTHEIGAALEALAAVIGQDGAEARLALAELLMLPTQRAA